MNKILKILTFVGLVPVTAVLVSYICEYILHLKTFSTSFLIVMLIIGLVVAISCSIFFKTKSAIGLVFAFLLVPYISFILGPIDIYMVDDNLAQGIQVIEVRPTIEKIEFTETTQGQITALQGPKTLKLHPGENEVSLGSLSLVAGSYTEMKVFLGTIEVDLTIDIETLINPDKYIPTDVPQDYTLDKTIYYRAVAEALGGTLEGLQLHYTYKLDPMEIPVPIAFPYPTGTGGPDVILDIILGEDGLPKTIQPKLNFPPGTPIPEQVKNMIITPNTYVDINALQNKYQSKAETQAKGLAEQEKQKATSNIPIPNI